MTKSLQVLRPIFLSHSRKLSVLNIAQKKGMAIANDVTIPLTLLQDRRPYVALGLYS